MKMAALTEVARGLKTVPTAIVEAVNAITGIPCQSS
jgi:hypothetical protein